MTFEFKLPDLGEGIHEAEVITLKVSEGQEIAENAPIMEVETDKALVEIPSPVGGIVQKIHVNAGQHVKVGMVMMTFTPKDGRTSTIEASINQAQAKPEMALAAQTHSKAVFSNGFKKRVLAAPSTRRLARELKVDLNLVSGSGPNGRVMPADIKNRLTSHLEGSMLSSEVKPGKLNDLQSYETYEFTEPKLNIGRNQDTGYKMPDFQKYGPIEKVQLKSVRAKIASHMTLSWTVVPHVAHFDEVEISDLMNILNKLQLELNSENIKLTLTAFALKAITLALKQFPEFNSSLDDNTQEIILKKYYNIGVAVATERGLLVPVIYNTDKKNLKQIACELNDTVNRTRNNKIKPDEMQGGTFTISNIGIIGGTGMSPMVNYPECAILGMATAKQQPIVRDNKIEIGNILPLALSFDHRITDGANAAYFIQYFKTLLIKPYKLLLE